MSSGTSSKIACKYIEFPSSMHHCEMFSFHFHYSLLYSKSSCFFKSLICVSLPESSPAVEPPSKRLKIEETFHLSEQQQQLIREDTANKKLWDEAMGHLAEGPVCISVHPDTI